MFPKVKMKMVQDGDYITYTIRSKSLTAVLQRATLLVEALGTDHAIAMDHDLVETKPNKIRHEINVYVS
jgi:hypothetical protein